MVFSFAANIMISSTVQKLMSRNSFPDSDSLSY